MSVILMNDSTMTDIADAIREKNGSTAQMYPSEMAGKIQSISQKETTKVKITLANTTMDPSISVFYGDKSVTIAEGQSSTIECTVGEIFTIYSAYVAGTPQIRPTVSSNIKTAKKFGKSASFYAKSKDAKVATISITIS